MKKLIIILVSVIIIIIVAIFVSNSLRINKFNNLIGISQEEVYSKVGMPTETSNGSDIYKVNKKEIHITYNENKIINHVNINGEYVVNS